MHVVITPKPFQDAAFPQYCAGSGRLGLSGISAAYQLSKDFCTAGISYEGLKSHLPHGASPKVQATVLGILK